MVVEERPLAQGQDNNEDMEEVVIPLVASSSVAQGKKPQGTKGQ